MQWQDEALVLGCRRAGETGVVLELMTRGHGRHAGWVHGGRSKRMAPVLQPGNTVDATWRARLDDQLGHFAVEPRTMRAASLLGSPAAMFGLATLAAHLRLLPERDPHGDLYESASHLVDRFGQAGWGEDFVRFELLLIAELGFGLDLTTCAATGSTDNLAFVSPRTGRAVSRAAGEPYAARLLALPPFLSDPALETSEQTAPALAGFALTSFFLTRHIYEPRGLQPPAERERLIARLASEKSVSGMFLQNALAAPDSLTENEA